jgi:hypothetical protein
MQTAAVLWAVAAVAAAVGMGVIVRTRWLQSRTLEKCIALSILLHAVLAVACLFIGSSLPASRGSLDEGPMTMLMVLDEPAAEATPAGADAAPPRDIAAAPALVPVTDAAASPAPPADVVPLLEPLANAVVDVADEDASRLDPVTESVAATDTAEQTTTAAVPTPVAPSPRPVPPLYADRCGGRRAAAAAARGGSADTERAVQAALGWLAAVQEPDGRWNAARHGAGRGRQAAGQHDSSVGGRSDHGVTALALLAFLGAGSTHQDGAYAPVVERGIRFLVGRQRADGSLAGDAEFFAALYCHGMATLALAECSAMSGDAALRPPLERAVQHTLATQHPVTGGWRYAAGDRGDTSQLGWQVMALTSARQAGVSSTAHAETLARGFLTGVSSGAAGGLASYRPRERPNQAMTAEALVCRLFLGLSTDHPVAREAIDFVGRTPPASAEVNIYTWYYATLASFHMGGPQWERWNVALQAALLPLQRHDPGPLAGSWDPDGVWGGHGGRVYSTALSALTLEVYYRHQPLFMQGARWAEFPR